MSNLLKKDKGFTLIEIVLVLAIAGLLLVIVFLAVSGAQKSRRDSARKNDASRLSALVTSMAGNAGGTLPTAAAVSTAWAGTGAKDPDGTAYTVVASATPAVDTIGYVTGAFCPGVGGTAGARDYAVYGYQETSTAVPFCVDTH